MKAQAKQSQRVSALEFLPNPPLHVTPNGEMATRSGRAAIIPSFIVNAFFPLLLFVWRLAVNKVP